MRVSRRERFIHRLSAWSGVKDGEMLPKWALALRWILCPLETHGRWYVDRRFLAYDFARNSFAVNGERIGVSFLSELIEASNREAVWKFGRGKHSSIYIEDVTDWWREMGKGKAS